MDTQTYKTVGNSRFMSLTGTLYTCEEECVDSFLLERGSGRDQHVLVGSVLPQLKTLLFAEDQQTEEGGGRLRACDTVTQRLQAEGGLAVALDNDRLHILVALELALLLATG